MTRPAGSTTPPYKGAALTSSLGSAAASGTGPPGGSDRPIARLSFWIRSRGLSELASTRVLDRARVLGAALRVAYLVSASTPGVLPRTPMLVERGRLVLHFEESLKSLAGERVFVRLRQLARLIGREPVMDAGEVPIMVPGSPS